MSFSLNILLRALLLILIFNVLFAQPAGEENDPELTKIFHEMNLDDNSILTKDQFKYFVRRLLTKGLEPNASNPFIDRIVEKVTDPVPEKIGMQEMATYLDQVTMMRVMEEVNKEFLEKKRQSEINQNEPTKMNINEQEPESNSDL